MTHLLFICSRNRLRSPTAERVCASWPGIEAASAGLNNDAVQPVTPELIEWADIIFVMEPEHRGRLSRKFRSFLGARRIICLDIPDSYAYMDPALISLVEVRVARHLPCR